MPELKRKKGEKFETFLRKFNKLLRNSRALMEARGRQFRNKGKTKRRQKLTALYNIEMHKEKDYLRKTGKLKEEDMYRNKRK